jgi:hypothetical protein
MRRFITIIAATAVLTTASAAFAASGGDPRDAKGGLDIKSSSIRVVTLDSGDRRVRFAVETYDAFDLSTGVGSFYWHVDTYGGTAADYEVYMFGDPKAVPAEPAFCLVKSLNPKVIYKAYEKVATSDTRVVCGVPRGDLKMTKDVRWRVAGRYKGIIDRAPDTGWYGG